MKMSRKGEIASKAEINELIKSMDTFFLDCDGVIWLGDQAIEGAAETINFLRAKGKRIFFVSNNSSKSSRTYMEKFRKFGIEAHLDEIYGTAKVAAWYLKHTLKLDKKVYLIGGDALVEEIDAVGIPHIGSGPDPLNGDVNDWLRNLTLDDNVGAVVQGLDYNISYMKVMKSASYLANKSCHLVITNEDDRLPCKRSDVVIPGTGTIAAMIKMASRRKEPIIIGKPERHIFDCIQSEHSIDQSTTCMIGDRLDTDILFGIRCGMKTALVLTGVTSPDNVEVARNQSPEFLPNYCLCTIADLMNMS